jgi:hypothetical protein
MNRLDLTLAKQNLLLAVKPLKPFGLFKNPHKTLTQKLFNFAGISLHTLK